MMEAHRLFELLRLAAGQASQTEAAPLWRQIEVNSELGRTYEAVCDLRARFDHHWLAFTGGAQRESPIRLILAIDRFGSWASPSWDRVKRLARFEDGWEIRPAYWGAAGREEAIQPIGSEGPGHSGAGVFRNLSAVEICRHDSVIGRLVFDPTEDRLSILVLPHLLPPEECRVSVVRGERQELAQFEAVEGTPYALAEVEGVTPESAIRIEIGRSDVRRF